MTGWLTSLVRFTHRRHNRRNEFSDAIGQNVDVSNLSNQIDNRASDNDRIPIFATVAACFGLEIPNPTAMGKSVYCLIIVSFSSSDCATESCAPVTPSRET